MDHEKKYGGILVVAEQNGGAFHKVTYELLNKGKELAEQLTGQGAEKERTVVSCLLLGPDGIDGKEANYRGAETVYYMKSDSFAAPEETLFQKNITAFIEEYRPEIVLVGATNFGRSLAPRVAAALETGLTADCTDLKVDGDGRLIQIRPAFSDNILAHIKTAKNPQMATIRYKEFDEAPRNEKLPESVKEIPTYFEADGRSRVIEMFSEEDFDITEAEVVVAGGRGIRRKEDLALLEELAELLGGKLGISRALVDAGLAGSSHQVGYSGNRVKPKVYIACGISGAPQHLAGMKESQVIIAINTDPSAPIFKIADVGYVGDLYEIVPKLTEELKAAGFGIAEKGAAK